MTFFTRDTSQSSVNLRPLREFSLKTADLAARLLLSCAHDLPQEGGFGFFFYRKFRNCLLKHCEIWKKGQLEALKAAPISQIQKITREVARSTRSCQKVAEQLVESPRSGYICYAVSFYCLFILFITNTFPCLCASSSFAHLSSVLVESPSAASVLRESLQLLFLLDVSMHLHFIKQSGYLKLFELT